MKENNKNSDYNGILIELTQLKQLMILFLLKAGASQTEIALALEINQSTVSRMFPVKKVKKFENLSIIKDNKN